MIAAVKLTLILVVSLLSFINLCLQLFGEILDLVRDRYGREEVRADLFIVAGP